jgi:hypothetical protein
LNKIIFYETKIILLYPNILIHEIVILVTHYVVIVIKCLETKFIITKHICVYIEEKKNREIIKFYLSIIYLKIKNNYYRNANTLKLVFTHITYIEITYIFIIIFFQTKQL